MVFVCESRAQIPSLDGCSPTSISFDTDHSHPFKSLFPKLESFSNHSHEHVRIDPSPKPKPRFPRKRAVITGEIAREIGLLKDAVFPQETYNDLKQTTTRSGDSVLVSALFGISPKAVRDIWNGYVVLFLQSWLLARHSMITCLTSYSVGGHGDKQQALKGQRRPQATTD